MSKVVTQAVSQKIVEAIKSGLKVKDVALMFKVSTRTVYRVLERARKAAVQLAVQPTSPKYDWLAGADFATVVCDGVSYSANHTHHKFAEIKSAVDAKNFELAINLINTKQAIQTNFGNIDIKGSQLYFHDIRIDNGLAKRIVESLGDNEYVAKLVVFLENLLDNPSRDVLYRLFEFLEHNDIQITDDGHFIAYKRVRNDYMDFYTGTMSNKPGEVVKVMRNQVDENQNQTCSFGLHVAAKTYLGHYHGGKGRILACKVHPKDVVAIPADYNNSKMRVCEYLVVEELNETH